MSRERPKVVVVKQGGGHGCVITVILVLLAWPLAIVYWILRTLTWGIGAIVDWLTAGPWRRRRR